MLQRGDMIGAYRVERELGRGGMGVVLLATDTALDRSVAIKSLPEEVARDPERLARFEREARTLAQLNHQNVAGIHGVERRGDERFLVLEYVEGETLAERLDRGVIPTDEAVEIAAQIAAGIGAAHDAGVIHRDLKPGNVMVTAEGVVKVLDFGLARAEGSSASSGSLDVATLTSPAQHSPTVAGVILGTAAYMSPEQARGRKIDRRTDIWSLGVILYEMLTGMSPFVGETATDSIGAVLHKDVDLARLPAGTPSGVRRVLERCLVRDKSARWRDAGDVRVELLAAGRGEDEPAAVGGGRSRAGWVVAGVLALMVVGMGLVAAVSPGVLGNHAGETRVVRSTIKAPDGLEIRYVSLSPDGERLLIIGRPIEPMGRRPEDQRVYVRDLASGVWRAVEGSEETFAADFSPDGSQIAMICDLSGTIEEKSLRLAPADGSSAAVQTLRIAPEYQQGGGPNWMSWTASGQIAMISSRDSRLDLIDPGSGRVVSSATITGENPKSIYGLAGAFGERHVAVVLIRYSERGYHEDVGLIDLTTGVLTMLVEDASTVRLLDDQTITFARGEELLVASIDPESVRVVGGLRVAEENGWRQALWSHSWLLVSDTGDMVYAEGGTQGAERTVLITEPDGTQRVWGEEPQPYEDELALSPNGERLAVTMSFSGGAFDVWGSEIDRPRLRRIIQIPGVDVSAPKFLPDNERLIVSKQSQGADNLDFLLVRFDGSGEPVSLLGEDHELGGRLWAEVSSVSADGAWAWISWFQAGRARNVRLALDGSGRIDRPFGDATAWNVQEAPDGSGLLVYRSDDGVRAGVFVRMIGEDGLTPAIPVSTEFLWGIAWRMRADGSPVISCVRPGGQMFFEVPVSVEESAGGVPRIVLGDAVEGRRVVPPDSVTGAVSLVGREAEILKGPDEKPVTELTLIQGWRDRVLEGAR
ncbi:MAG: protein kinase [Phycisphaerales bacterium]